MKSRKKPVVLLATAALTAAALLSGCGAPASGGGAATLQVETNMTAGSEQLAVLTTLAQEFEASHAGVKLDLIPSSTTYEQDIKVKLAARNAPDIWQTHGWSRDRYAEFLAPLQDRAWNKDVNKLLDPSMRSEDGSIYAVPMVTDVAGLVYNADVLKKAGVDPATLTTWDAFDAAAAKIKAGGVVPISVSGKANGPAGNIIDWMAPGMFTDTELDAFKSGQFQAAGYTAMLTTVADWSKKGYFNPDYSSATQDDVAKALGSGKAAFVFSQNTVVASALAASPDANLGFMPIPSKVGKSYLIGGEGIAYGASAAGANLDAAKEFLDYLAQPASQEAFAKASGGVPGIATAKTDLGHLQDSYDAWVVKAGTTLVPYYDRVYLPNGLWNTLVTSTDSVITGQGTPESATSQVEKDFTSLYGQQ
jgi:raffinose/stachyose/melibiose transport system substrate-binding protein